VRAGGVPVDVDDLVLVVGRGVNYGRAAREPSPEAGAAGGCLGHESDSRWGSYG
jgi:hypothetical protein